MFKNLFEPRTCTGTERTIRDVLGAVLVDIAPVGSRVTCDPAPVGTDEDWLVHVRGDPKEALENAGFTQDGMPGFYTGNDAGSFRSWRKGDVNVVTTPEYAFYELFLTATELAKRFNLLHKHDRIALFQAVLYGVRWINLEQAPTVYGAAAAVSSDTPI